MVTKKEVSWEDLSQETRRQLYLWGTERKRQRRAGEPGSLDPLPPPIDDGMPAPPVELDALRLLASDAEMPDDEVNRLYRLIDIHRSWYDTYHQLLRENMNRRNEGQQPGA